MIQPAPQTPFLKRNFLLLTKLDPLKGYRIVASSNARYYLKNQLLVETSQYIRTKNPLHKQSEKAYM